MQDETIIAARKKIVDVMLRLGVIRDGQAVDPRVSAEVCWNLLDEVLELLPAPQAEAVRVEE